MITTTMSANEVLQEYKRDYEECLRGRLSSLASRKTHDLKVAKGKLIKVPDLTIKTPSGNTYQVRCKLMWDRRKGAGWCSVSYLKTLDSRTGRRVVYVLSDSFPILLSASFLGELGMGVSEFLGYGANWDVVSCESENPRYTDYINFGEGIGAGVGGWKNGVLILRHLIKSWEEDPLSDFLKGRETEEPDPIQKSDIDNAWEEYLKGEL